MKWWMLNMSVAIVLSQLGIEPLKGEENRFSEDVAFLSRHVEVVVLEADNDDLSGPRVAVVPAYQCRVMTSTSGGEAERSYGWINYDHIASGKVAPQINVVGGEERFWLGPEGGQFGLYFAPGSEFSFTNWKVPAFLDTEPFTISSSDSRRLVCERRATCKNHSGTEFQLEITRSVELLAPSEIAASAGVDVSQIRHVGYRTANRVTNVGQERWTAANGLLSVWLLGMFKPSPSTTIVLPYKHGSANSLGPIVNDDYFGAVPASRLHISDAAVYFSGDGKQRGKIGLSPQRTTDVCGSFDAERGVLTIVKYNKPEVNVELPYVNSKWVQQSDPFKGDVVNAYNDGPPEPGKTPLGPFYELETSSPALALGPGESFEHIQETFHFEGTSEELAPISQQVLAVSIGQIETALNLTR